MGKVMTTINGIPVDPSKPTVLWIGRGKPPQSLVRQESTVPCPRCGDMMVKITPRMGNPFYCCETCGTEI